MLLDDLRLSELIKVAVEDVKIVIDKGYKLDMSRWVDYTNCQVCFAGAVLLCEELDGKCSVNKSSFFIRPAPNYARIATILNRIRLGDVEKAISMKYGVVVKPIIDFHIKGYNERVVDVDQFCVYMLSLSEYLNKKGY